MFKIIAVTDSKTCSRPLLSQISYLKNAPQIPNALILRAKELSASEYFTLAQQVQNICQQENLPLILHTHWQIALRLKQPMVHLPLKDLAQIDTTNRKFFTYLSTSVHNLAELQQALTLGATHIVAGHIYATNCKANLPPRGLHFLQEICANTKLPVYAIGGIKFDSKQWQELKNAHAAGCCIMSAYMQV